MENKVESQSSSIDNQRRLNELSANQLHAKNKTYTKINIFYSLEHNFLFSIVVLSEFVGPANRIYGRVARAWLFVVPLFVITEPNDIQSILASSKHTDKIFVYRFMHNFLGNGLITSNGENWQTHRRLIQPMFHRQVLERFLGGFLRASENLVKLIDGQNNMDFNITKLINECVLDVLNGKPNTYRWK